MFSVLQLVPTEMSIYKMQGCIKTNCDLPIIIILYIMIDRAQKSKIALCLLNMFIKLAKIIYALNIL